MYATTSIKVAITKKTITRTVGNETTHKPYLQRAAWCGNSRGIHLMGNLNVAVLGKPSYGSALGNKGTSTDITFYKKGIMRHA